MSNRSTSPAPSTTTNEEDDEPQVLAVPVKLDAFIFNVDVCGGSGTLPDKDENKDCAKIAPFKQPNYTFLRFERSKVQNDTLEFTDLHKTGPAAFNTRFTDLGTKKPYPDRQGVYLHWIVPRGYRIGSTVAQDFTTQQHSRAREGFVSVPSDPAKASKGQGKRAGTNDHPDHVDQGDTKAPDFRPAPSRWMIIRKVETCDPLNALPDLDAWVVESNRYTTLDNIGTDKDIQVEYAPYILAGKTAADMDKDAIKTQAEVFIGYKENASTWVESEVPHPLPTDPQRVDLNLVNSSNPLFADYQPHNGNVFSIVDTLKYKSNANSEPTTVKKATVSYYVFGWHALEGQDPFGSLDPNAKPSVTRGQRLAALKMILDQTDKSTAQGITDWMESPEPTQLICHGAMYNVEWKATGKPTYMPADDFYEKVKANVPVAVGTTPMDSLLTYIKKYTNPTSVDGEDDIKKVMQDLLLIEKLLHARGDGVDAQAEAEDIVYNWNYASSNGGLHYFLTQGFKDNEGKPTQPSKDNIKALNDINTAQDYLDCLDRQVVALRWNMFAYWWEYLSDLNEPDPIKTGGVVTAMTTAFTNLVNMRNNMATKVLDLVKNLPKDLAKQGALPPFFVARDPTMLVAGVESGWPWDFLQDLQARLDTQIVVPSASIPPLKPGWGAFLKAIASKLPTDLTDAAVNLVKEFLALNPENLNQPVSGDGYKLPLYHDLDKTHLLPHDEQPWRDRWEERQAWFPLFLEWVAEYNHVPFTPFDVDGKIIPACWSLEPRESWPSVTQAQKLRYGIKTGIELADENIQDKRTVSGRVLILPQASLNLHIIVEQILDNLPDGYLNPDQVKELRDHLHELAFLSSPLSGFTNHLITRVQGNHIKPTLRAAVDSTLSATDDIVPFKAAIEVGSKANFGDSQLRIMGIETDMTPYGTLVQVGSLNNDFCPFKPVTHGQFRFTALNIIDKFGQAIPIIDQTPVPIDKGPPPLYPYISEYYSPQASNKDPNKANTVVYDKDETCQYLQISPSINQPARLNFAFVDYFDGDKAASTAAGWRPLQEWDTGFVWGWVVPNYADSGIQLFLSDGTFFREIRLGGPHGATSSGTSLPFPAPPVSTDPDFMQLELLAEKLMDAGYLHSFVAMLDMALGTIAPPPNAYSEFLSSIIGRPLALVKAAYSLELATQPYTNQSTLVDPPIPPTQELQRYEFGIHLGDASRIYDGLIAYFLPQQTPSADNSIDLSTIYTHFVPPDPQVPVPNLTEIGPANYPTVKPFWQDPMDPLIVGPPEKPNPDPQASYAMQWNSHLVPVGALVDPFVPFHAYSSILPTAPAQLPAWTWQVALKRMTAFFHMGPLLSTRDVPEFNDQHALAPTYSLTDDAQMMPGAGLGTPAMQTGEWAWLQPYSVPVNDEKGQGEGGEDEDETGTQFMALSLEAVDTRPRLEPSPYTAVEGYMQLRMPIEQGIKP